MSLTPNKYDIIFSDGEIDKMKKRLINQLWKLIPMKENEEDWKKQIDTVLIEMSGLQEIFDKTYFIQILSKLEGLKIVDISFELYRKTVFECINLLQELRD